LFYRFFGKNSHVAMAQQVKREEEGPKKKEEEKKNKKKRDGGRKRDPPEGRERPRTGLALSRGREAFVTARRREKRSPAGGKEGRKQQARFAG